MAIQCVIEFENNPSMVYYTGQLIRGNVRLSLTESKSVRGVYVKIMGIGHVYWTEGTGDNRKTHTGNEDYFHERTYFLGGQIGEVRLMAGTYNYTFQCLLPRQLPTSIEGSYGHIRYTATVVVDIPMWPDKEFEVPFTVVKSIDLNANPALREPVIAEERKTFFLCCLLCCTTSDPLDITARIPVGGYTPGQTINLTINVKNESDQPVTEFTVQLIKQIDFHTHANSSDRQRETIVLVELDARGCEVNQQRIIQSNILVPSIPPTDNTTSSLIKVQYFVRIIGSVACCHSNPVVLLPIIIGSYPILDYPVPQQPTINQSIFPPVDPASMPTPIGMPMPALPMNGVISQQPIVPTAPNVTLFEIRDTNAPFLNDDPPTYEESMQFGTDERKFRPKYPVFKRTTSYSSADNQ